MSASVTAASRPERMGATLAACGLPGPPGLPLAKRPWRSRPFGPFVDGLRMYHSSAITSGGLLAETAHEGRRG